jgi:hypothetical protein
VAVALELGNFQAPGGASGLGTLRVVEIHPQGTCNQTTVLAGLPTPVPGFVILRLGIDCPCGAAYECYQISMSWRIADQPGSQGTVAIRFYSTEILGNHPIRTPVLDLLQLDQDLVYLGDTDPTLLATVLGAPIYQTVTTGTLGADGAVTVDVTAAYNAAKAAGYTYFNARLRITDPSPTDCLNGTTWYALVKVAATVSSPYNPVLLIGAGEGVGGTLGPVTMALSVNEPELEMGGFQIAHLRAKPDFEQDHQLIQARRGNTIRFEVTLLDHWYQPPRPFDGAVLLTLTAQDGTVVLANAVLVRVDLGVYAGVYQTQVTDPINQVYVALVEYDA